jgi:hypothetical protein
VGPIHPSIHHCCSLCLLKGFFGNPTFELRFNVSSMFSLSSCKLILLRFVSFLGESRTWRGEEMYARINCWVLWVFWMLTYCMLGGVVFSGSRFVFWMLILCLMYNLLQCLFLLVMCNEVKDQRTEEFCFCKVWICTVIPNYKNSPLFWTHRPPLISRYHNQIFPVLLIYSSFIH